MGFVTNESRRDRDMVPPMEKISISILLGIAIGILYALMIFAGLRRRHV